MIKVQNSKYKEAIKTACKKNKEWADLEFQIQYVSKILDFATKKAHEIEITIIKELQEKCDHDFEYDGHGHNYSYYKCSKCALSREE